MPKKRPHPNEWPPERYAQFKKLWLRGWPFLKIAKCLSFTWGRPVSKNTCIGKAYRMRDERRPKFAAYMAPDIDAILPKPGHCSWPEGHPDKPGYHCCGAKALPGKPYCAAHAARAYVKPKEERRAA
jgi:GcrA cell cycle regulator